MAGGVEGVLAFAEDPFVGVKLFSQGEVVGVDANDGEVALATGGDIKAEAVTGLLISEEFGEAAAKGVGDELLAIPPAIRGELAELSADLVCFQVEALDRVIHAALLDG